MATVYQYFTPDMALFQTTAFPQLKVVNGTNFPVMGLYYDTTTSELAYFPFKLRKYGTGVDMTVTLDWYADTASSGGVVWEAAIAAIVPNGTAQDVETKTFGTAVNAADSHLTGTAQRLHSVAITLSGSAQLNSALEGGSCWMRIARLTANGSDNLTGDAVLVGVELSYSDT